MPTHVTAAELARGYRGGDLSPVEVARQALEQAEREQPRLNAFITLLPDAALEAARQSEARYRQGQPLGPLDGVPVALKDLVHMAGVRTTAASKVLDDYVATEDADIARRLQAGGAILFGKTNLHEFAFGPSGDVSHYGPTRNPHNTERIAGGSSSGSGAAVAAGICPVALGTDTGGSIRIPASLCGIVGLKPTYGRVSTRGVIPLSWSLDHVGPMTSTVEDAALALSVFADFQVPSLELGRTARVGVCRELLFESLDAEVRAVVEAALPDVGDVREIAIENMSAVSAQSVILGTDAATYHLPWLKDRPQDYDATIRARLETGLVSRGVDYVQATRLRGLFVAAMYQALRDIDVLAAPTTPIAAPPFGEVHTVLEDGSSQNTAALLLRNTSPFNLCGFPAISVPCGRTAAGLPVGLHLVAKPWDEATLLQVAAGFERSR
jgi:aspartyl-tRNA(Asn)/glutamyl-tRNA(Gln) amidotransferase subunit A